MLYNTVLSVNYYITNNQSETSHLHGKLGTRQVFGIEEPYPVLEMDRQCDRVHHLCRCIFSPVCLTLS